MATLAVLAIKTFPLVFFLLILQFETEILADYTELECYKEWANFLNCAHTCVIIMMSKLRLIEWRDMRGQTQL